MSDEGFIVYYKPIRSLMECPDHIVPLTCKMPKERSLEEYAFEKDIINYNKKLKVRCGLFLEAASKVINDGNHQYIHDNPADHMPIEVYEDIMRLKICPRCGNRGLLVHVTEFTDQCGMHQIKQTCCYK
jgi:ribosomal protein S27AE